MLSPLDVSSDSISLIVGGLGNAVIFVLSGLEWSRTGIVSPYRTISCSMSLSNLAVTCLQLGQDILTRNMLFRCIDLLGASFLCFSLWMSTILYLYYCIKIGAGHSTVNAWLNIRFPAMLPYLIISFLGISLLSSFTIIFMYLVSPSYNISSVSAVNIENTTLNEDNINLITYVQTAYGSLSFLMSSCLVGRILLSLYQHVHHVQSSEGGLRNVSLKAQYKAAKTVSALLVFNLIFLFSIIANFFTDDIDKLNWLYELSSILICVSTSAQPFILILGNTKMKKEAKETFLHFLRKFVHFFQI
ncbi:hypothetical protein GDO86_013519 [Hymenochirus boettgeri]|uniref:Taste receptor type 2 n=1 Tax=Hymenochirus boettgeri TaxID=247094 RepID=A0A8T2IRP6_9PIPI|nr:hypothetical protein GDO86_013519 [Hymenochirus boettgeri]